MRSIRNWYEGRNAPTSGHSIQLAKVYPAVFRVLLDLVGRPDLWELCQAASQQLEVEKSEHTNRTCSPIYYEKNFVINVVLNPAVNGKFNQRQLWFLGLLQRHHKVKPDDIVSFWRVTLRTAQADIAGLVQAELIYLVGARKTGWYEVAHM